MKVAGFKVRSETDRALLLHDKKKGDFWVPKALIRNDTIYHEFIPSYLPSEEIVNDMQSLIADEPKAQKVWDKIEVRVKPFNRKKVVIMSTPQGPVDSWFLDWLGVEHES